MRRKWEKLRRHRAGRKRAEAPPAHHLEWASAHAQTKAVLEQEYDERGRLGLLDPTERAPTDRDAAAAVAEHDCRSHPERWAEHYWRWDVDEDGHKVRTIRPELADAAADRVLKAVKRLQSARTEITAT